MAAVNSLAGFREDTLDLGFEQAARLSFTLCGVRADDTPLDLDVDWTYEVGTTPTSRVLLKGRLRVLEEKLSPTEDSQRYELTDKFDDLSKEPLTRLNEAGTDQTVRFTFNKDTNPGVEDNVKTAVEVVEAVSAITTGVDWTSTSPTTAKIDKNINLEGRGIGEFLTTLMKYAPAWRWYYDSNTGKVKMVDLEATVTPKEVYLSKLGGKWHLRSPKLNNVIDLNLRIDKTDCYEKVRLEGLGKFKYRTDVALEPGWYSPCLGTDELANCLDITDPPFLEQIHDCDSYACRYLFPAEYKPAAFQFTEEGGIYRASPQNELIVFASKPMRNLGRCKQAKDYPGGVMPPVGSSTRICDPQETPWEWTDYESLEISRIPPPSAKNSCGEYVIDLCPRKLMSMLPFWSPGGAEHVDEYPEDPKITPWPISVAFWDETDALIVEKTGGCVNGRVYVRYNNDWLHLTDENDVVVLDDETVMNDLADKLLAQVGKPKISGEITIHLHPRSTASPYGESYVAYEVAKAAAFIDFLGIALGDAVNIIYDPTEAESGTKWGVDPYPDGKGVLPDAGPGPSDLDWEHMDDGNIRVMGLSFNRIGQTLKISIANSPYIFGDREVSNGPA